MFHILLFCLECPYLVLEFWYACLAVNFGKILIGKIMPKFFRVTGVKTHGEGRGVGYLTYSRGLMLLLDWTPMDLRLFHSKVVTNI